MDHLNQDFVCHSAFPILPRSLVSTNDHLLQELDEARQRHQHEVHQMHWSYDNLKKTIDWLPNSVK